MRTQEDLVVKYGSNVILGLTWAALVGYAFLYSPNQTPIRDQYFLEKLVGLGVDNVPVNTVFTALFNAMGLWPAMYSALIIPTGKSENGVRRDAACVARITKYLPLHRRERHSRIFLDHTGAVNSLLENTGDDLLFLAVPRAGACVALPDGLLRSWGVYAHPIHGSVVRCLTEGVEVHRRVE